MIRCHKAITDRKSPKAHTGGGEGSARVARVVWRIAALWLIIKPGGHSAGVERVKLHPLEVGVMISGM